MWRGSEVVELRRYTLVPGRRDELIELFERELLDPQEAVGMRVLGQFLCPHEPDVFIWLRGFTDMASRPGGLAAFYGGPVWAEHREAANATMVDSDNVLLLNPVRGDDAHPIDASAAVDQSSLTLTIQRVERAALAELGDFLDQSLDRLRGSGVIAVLVSEPSPNNFEPLPVRDDGPFVVALCGAGHAGAAGWRRLRPRPIRATAASPRPLNLCRPTSRESARRLGSRALARRLPTGVLTCRRDHPRRSLREL